MTFINTSDDCLFSELLIVVKVTIKREYKKRYGCILVCLT